MIIPPAQALLGLREIARPVADDLTYATEQLKVANARLQGGDGELQELCFWGKAVVGSLFSHMDAVGYAARTFAVLFRTDATPLTPREIARLSEYRYGADKDSAVRYPDPLTPLQSFKLGVKYFSRCLGATFELATGDARWRGVVDVWKARRRFTHPKRIEDLYGFEMFGGLQSTLVWYHAELVRLFATCEPSFANHSRGWPELRAATLVRPTIIPQKSLFTDEELSNDIEAVGSRALAYATEFLRLLRYDSTYLAEARRTVSGPASLEPSMVRLTLRTECTQIEALGAAIRFQLLAARRRGEIAFADTELHPDSRYPASVGGLVKAAGMWSRAFGSGRAMVLSPQTVSQVTEAWKRRDRLIHPREVRAFQIEPLAAWESALALYQVQSDAHECLRIDERRWMDSFRRGSAAAPR